MKNRQHYGYDRNLTVQAKNILSVESLADRHTADTARGWLCATQKSASADADIWGLCYQRETNQNDFLQQLQTEKHRFSLMQMTEWGMWISRGASALKWLALRLQNQRSLHETCEHLKGLGSGESSVMQFPSSVQTGRHPRAVVHYHEKLRRFYEWTRHWLKQKKVRRVSGYSQQWKKYALGLLLTNASVHSPVLAASYEGASGTGWQTLPSVNVSSSVYERCAPYAAETSKHGYFYSPEIAAPVIGRSSDGVAYGVLIPGTGDVWLAFDGTMKIYRKYWSPENLYTAYTLSSEPTTTGSGTTYTSRSGTQFMLLGGGGVQNNNWIEIGANLTGTMGAALYFGPKAIPGSYGLPSVKYNVSCFNSSVIVSAGALTVLEPIACSVSAPDVVDFGTTESIDAGQGKLLAVAHQNITVTCSGVSGQVASNTKTSFQGLGDWGTNWGQLNLMNSGGRSPGYVRGRYLENADGTCSGDSTNEVAFDGRTRSYSNLKVGSNSIPITWSLCSWGNKVLGKSSAQATFMINWD